MSGLPSDSNDPPATFGGSLKAGLAWYLSRTLFAGTILGIAFLVKEPLGQLAERMSMSDTKALTADEEVGRLRVASLLRERARKTHVAYADTLRQAQQYARTRTESDRNAMRARRQRALTEYTQLEEDYFGRKYPLSDPVEDAFVRFIRCVGSGLENLEEGVEARHRMGRKPPTFSAARALSRSLYAAIEELEMIGRQNLVKQGQGL